MPFKSLYDLASRACIKNIKYLDSVGDFLPYEKVQHLLVRVEDADQLRNIEINSPQIQGRTGELWLKLIEKDFPLELRDKAYKPVDPTKWHRVYKKYKKEHDEKEAEAQRQLRAAMAGVKEDRNKVKVQLVSWKQLPNQAKRGARKPTASSSMAFTAGTRTKTSSGRSVMKKAKREAKDIANIHGSLSRTMGAPKAQSQMKRAPQGMIDEHRRAALPGVRKVEEPKPKVQKVPEAVKAHEERATYITDSEDDEDKDLFDEEPRPRKSKPFASSASKASPSKPATRPPSAAASLLKTRPKTAPGSRSVKDPPPPKKETGDRPVASKSDKIKQTDSKPTTKIASSRPQAASPPPRSSKPAASSSAPEKTKPTAKETASSRPKAASPPSSSSKPQPSSSDQEKTKPSESQTGEKETKTSQPPPPRPMKRKAPSMFMKPNKRVH